MAQQHTFVPTLYEIAGYLIVAVAVLGVLTLEPVIKNTNAPSYIFLTDTFGHWFMHNLAKLNTPRMTVILTYVLWAIVGALVYMLVWAITSLFKSVEEDVSPFHNLIPPQGYNPSKGLSARVARSILRIIGLVGFFVIIGMFFSKILPFSLDQFVSSLTRVDLLSVAGLFLAAIYIAASLFAMTVALRLVLLRRRVLE